MCAELPLLSQSPAVPPRLIMRLVHFPFFTADSSRDKWDRVDTSAQTLGQSLRPP